MKQPYRRRIEDLIDCRIKTVEDLIAKMQAGNNVSAVLSGELKKVTERTSRIGIELHQRLRKIKKLPAEASVVCKRRGVLLDFFLEENYSRGGEPIACLGIGLLTE